MIGAVLPLAACAPNLGDTPQPRSAASLAATRSLPNEAGAWPGDGWWQRYGDPQLSQLIEEGLAGAPDLSAAAARLARAEGVVRSAGGRLGPSLVAEGSAGKVKQSYNNGFPREFLPQGWRDTGTLNVQGGFDLDLWGRNRASLRAAVADRDAARIEAQQARITLAASIAEAYAELARLYSTRDVTEEAVRIQGDTAELVAQRVRNGLDTEGQRRQAQSQVPAARADLGAVDEQITTTRNRIAALIGAGPDRGLAIARPLLSALAPAALPASAGIDLVARRPDIAAARARVEAAGERIKVAHAAFYPDISLQGLVGFQALGFGNVLKQGSLYGNVGPAISLPIFDQGQRSGDYRVARADYDAAVADYDGTLIQALREVADAVASRNALGQQLSDARASLADSRQAYEIARLRYKAGLSTFLDVLSAEQSVIAARRRESDLSARAFTLDVTLVRALGGGFVA
ncbi:efflux transporter outer membrane subunit [uncultured Sphingomonas sp.]|uniref:efflux transporter outer membrane subunit n=1 Tax=uncultured Sphingomonas sp. TaxID=158754 RepID=UPI0025D0C269|nr:efflux transporter outer membrane subunit [uncultured Sphingomonas sp.]